jgi:Xaa-Pro aminopeptidase
MTAYAAVRRELDAAGVDLLVVGPTANLRYLTGYDSLATDRLLTLLVTRDAAVLVLPQMEVSAVVPRNGEIVVGWEDTVGPADALADAFSLLGPVSSAAFEEWLPYRSVAALSAHVPLDSVRPAGDILARPRLVKSAAELEGMAVAAALVDAVAADVLRRIRPGTTEREVAGEIARELWRRGADREAHILVAAGPRAALHHQTPGDAAVRVGESMLVDLAASVDGHWADITRQVFLGEADPEYASAYALVAAAEEAGVQAARPGVTAHELDRAALSVLHDAGYGRWASGRTGHGIGREVHEAPSLVAGNELVLEAGMVVTVEPGIYIDGRFGIRIEDTVVVGNPPRRLTHSNLPLAAVELRGV